MPHQPITDAELKHLDFLCAALGGPCASDYVSPAAHSLPRLVAEVKRLREVEKAHWDAARAVVGNWPAPS